MVSLTKMSQRPSTTSSLLVLVGCRYSCWLALVVILLDQLTLTEAWMLAVGPDASWLTVDQFSTSRIVFPKNTASFLSTSSSRSSSAVENGVSQWLALTSSAAGATLLTTATTATLAAVAEPPSQADIQLLRSAFAEFYGVNRDLSKSQVLLTQVIEKWQNQPPDERAGLYRVRGDCSMALLQPQEALQDYDQAVQLLQQEQQQQQPPADPQELSASLLGRARAAKVLAVRQSAASSGGPQQQQLASRAAADYRQALILNSREDWDDTEQQQEMLEDGASRNPYAAWEWGDALRLSGRYREAAVAHALASAAFDAIGDTGRSVMALTDAGIDYASVASASVQEEQDAIRILQKAIQKTKGVEGRDLDLLRRVVRKEGEGRMALAATLWTSGDKGQAEKVMGDACLRLDQLQAQIDIAAKKARGSSSASVTEPVERLLFSIDDDERGLGPLFDCSKFRNPKFVRETLGWPESLQAKVTKLVTLR